MLSKLFAYEQLKPRITSPLVISISKSGLDLNDTLSVPSDSSSDIEWLMLNLMAILKLKYVYYNITSSRFW